MPKNRSSSLSRGNRATGISLLSCSKRTRRSRLSSSNYKRKLSSSSRLRRSRGMNSREWKNHSNNQWSSGKKRSRRRGRSNKLWLKRIWLKDKRGLRTQLGSKNLHILRSWQKKSVYNSKLSRRPSSRRTLQRNSKLKKKRMSSASVKRLLIVRGSFWSKSKGKRLSKPSYVCWMSSKRNKRQKELHSSPENLNWDWRKKKSGLSFKKSRRTTEICLTRQWPGSRVSLSSTRSKRRSSASTMRCKNRRSCVLESSKRKRRRLKEWRKLSSKFKGSRKSRRRLKSRLRATTLLTTLAHRSRLR